MTALQVFQNPDFGEIRTTALDNAPWFVGKDIAAALGYSNTRKAIADHVDPEDKGVTKCDTLNGAQRMVTINESGLYSLILSSKLPAAKKFKRWVTSEVLPAIRQSGGYGVQPSAPVLADLERRLAELEAKLASPPALPRRRRRREAKMTYEIKTNPQHNSLEIYFDGKPSAAVRTALKELHFRWYPAGGYWWGYAPEREVAAAIDGAA